MGSPFVGEIRMFAGTFAPQGWALCDGSLMSIAQNDALFQLIGTTYGGDGQSTFGMPDLRGRVPVHAGPGFAQGQMGGAEAVTLTTQQIPAHTHTAGASTNPGTSDSPAGAVAWASVATPLYSSGTPTAQMSAAAIGANAGGQPHSNVMPFVAVNYIISLFGIFPSQ
jgi:microcystin-dependent protein